MIDFCTHLLNNGLQLVIHQDNSCSTALLNLVYSVGSKHESPEKTGIAHLFEHLMFSGSRNVQSFDSILHGVGGTNNAYTSFDVTSYYIITPSSNIETSFWVESDRMMYLNLSEDSLSIQKRVVIEEFKEVYLNKPYGDVYALLLNLAYKKHPYRWPTIGRKIEDINGIQKIDIENFYNKFYAPNNAVLVVSGGIDKNQVIDLSHKWFETIPPKGLEKQFLTDEEIQNEHRIFITKGKVPHDAVYKAFHIPGKKSIDDYYCCELLALFLSSGSSNKLHMELVEKKKIFSSISAFTIETFDPSLLIIYGLVLPNISISQANIELDDLIETVRIESILEEEFIKIKNCLRFSNKYESMDLLSRSDSIALSAILGNVNAVNEKDAKIEEINSDDLDKIKKNYLIHTNCSTLLYEAER